ncbi:MAG: hypothetical protein KatS3mg028_0220 [Bacteroidia bacterium]|nr:MAG: hypothetical protein KatS3mg028_0220 [Bacteroidia bacterium]
MLRLIVIHALIGGIVNCHAQSFSVQKDTTNIHLLIQKKKQYHQLTKGMYDGYRVKIFFDVSREKMERVKSEFQSKYPDIPVYNDYVQPNFILVIGNCKTKMEAHELLKKIQPDYPNAFIIKTKIIPTL